MILYIVIPCYNEQEVLQWAVDKLQPIIETLQNELQITTRLMLVDDGSKDETWNICNQLTQQYPNVEALKLAHKRWTSKRIVGRYGASCGALRCYGVDRCRPTRRPLCHNRNG